MRPSVRIATPSLPVLALAAGLALFGSACTPTADAPTPAPDEPGHEFGIVIHGGAGTITRENMTDELEANYHAAAGRRARGRIRMLEEGASALDAVVAAVRIMEDDPSSTRAGARSSPARGRTSSMPPSWTAPP
jgi:hypothetical protein